MDERDRALYDEKIRSIDQRVRALEHHEAACKGDIFPRLNALELWKASMMASAMRSAFVIGACSMVGAALAVFISHLLKVAR